MNIFVSLNKGGKLNQNERQLLSCKDVPVAPAQCRESKVYENTPIETLIQNVRNEWGDENARVYLTIGVPSDFNCLLLLMELSSMTTMGFDRRAFAIVEGHSYGMGMRYLLNKEAWGSVKDLEQIVQEWRKTVDSVPRESGGHIVEWRGQRFRHRDFVWTVSGCDDMDALIKILKSVRLQWVDHTSINGKVEIVSPGKAQLAKLCAEGLIVWKDWTPVTMGAPDGK